MEDKLSYDELYVASLSPKTIVYKARSKLHAGCWRSAFIFCSRLKHSEAVQGMLKSSAMVLYYKDLGDPRFKVQYALWRPGCHTYRSYPHSVENELKPPL